MLVYRFFMLVLMGALVMGMSFQQVDPQGGVHSDQVGKLAQRRVQKALRPRSVQQQNIRPSSATMSSGAIW